MSPGPGTPSMLDLLTDTSRLAAPPRHAARRPWPGVTVLASTVLASTLLAALAPACGKKAPPTPPEQTIEVDPGPATAAQEAETWEGAGAPTGDQLAVAVIDVSGGTVALELVCPSGHRDRVSLVRDAAGIGGTARFDQVPEESCTLHFKGGSPAQFAPVQGGQALSCNLQATTAVCR